MATRKGVSFWHVSSVLGGSERSFLDLVESSIDVSKIYLPSKGPLADAIREGAWASHLDFFWFPKQVRKLSRTQGWRNLYLLPLAAISILAFGFTAMNILRRDRPALVYSHGLKLHILLTPIARLMGIPVIWHLQDFWPRSWLASVLLRLLASMNITIICDSKSVADAMPLTDRSQIFFVHNAIDLQDHPFVEYIQHDSNQICFVGMLTPWKGPHIFIEAARHLKLIHKDSALDFILVGGMPYDADQSNVSYGDELRRNAEGAVRLLGLLPDTKSIYQAAGIFCHCSIAPEPFGRVILEAMASGAIVIAANQGGPREIVEDGVSGFLCTPEDPQQLADKIQQVLAMPEDEKSRIAISARKRVEEKFSREFFQAQIVEKIDSVLRGST